MTSVSLDSHVFRPMSHRLARGLGRDLFRHLEDRVETSGQLLQTRLNSARLAYRSRRDAKAVYERCRSALRNCGYGFREVSGGVVAHSSCTVFMPEERQWESGETETILMALFFVLSIEGISLSVKPTPAGTVSHHAVQRMFERMGTTSKTAVLNELVSSSALMSKLMLASCISESSVRIQQIVVPTDGGALLCRVEKHRSCLDARSYIRQGTNRRIDASIQSILQWNKSMMAGLSKKDVGSKVAELVSRPENHWWRNQYAGSDPGAHTPA